MTTVSYTYVTTVSYTYFTTVSYTYVTTVSYTYVTTVSYTYITTVSYTYVTTVCRVNFARVIFALSHLQTISLRLKLKRMKNLGANISLYTVSYIVITFFHTTVLSTIFPILVSVSMIRTNSPHTSLSPNVKHKPFLLEMEENIIIS